MGLTNSHTFRILQPYTAKVEYWGTYQNVELEMAEEIEDKNFGIFIRMFKKLDIIFAIEFSETRSTLRLS